MSTKKSAGGKKVDISSSPEWLRRIDDLRRQLGINQAELAARLDLSSAAVSYWFTSSKKGNPKEPARDTYIKLGNLAVYPDNLWFWARGGVNVDSVTKLSSTLQAKIAKAAKPSGGIAYVPVLKDLTFVSEPGVAPPDEIEDRVPLPASLIPNPAATSCIRARDDSMEPAFYKGDLMVIDASDRRIDGLRGAIIAAYHTEHERLSPPGLYVGRLGAEPIVEEDGLPVFLLQSLASSLRTYALLREMVTGKAETSRPNTPLMAPISNRPTWNILGRVIYWIGSDQRFKKPEELK